MGGNSILIKKGCLIKNLKIEISGENNKLVIGENCQFYGGGWIRMRDRNGHIIIGDNLNTSYVFMMKDDNNTNIEIGDNCLFSANIIFRTSDSHSILDRTTNERVNIGANIKIEDNVWIGYGANILKGSKIGHDSVIGTQTVFSGKEIPPYSLVVGVPGKVVRSNICWNAERF